LVAGSAQQLTTRHFALVFELNPHCNFQRKPRFPPHDLFALPWPFLAYTVSLAQPQAGFQAPTGFLVGPHAPTFAAFGAAVGAFFHGNYALAGAQNPSLGQLNIRIPDERGRITGINIELTKLRVETDGSLVDEAQLELMATTDRVTVKIEVNGSTEVPIPNGLPPDAWLWLRSETDWLDYRPLSGWTPHSPDVRDDRPTVPGSDLAAMAAQGENQHVEYKSQLPTNTRDSRRTGLKGIMAFANGEGGTVLYGVANDGTVPGIPDADDRTVDGFVDQLRASTTPMPSCKCSVQTLDDKRILVIEVPANTGTIYALTVEPNKPEFYVRRGANSFPARPEELQVIPSSQASPVLSGLHLNS
jgi:hypothetical protein